MTTFGSITTEPITYLKLDIAIIERDYTDIKLKNIDEHMVSLDSIDIQENVFKNMFYSDDNFKVPTNEWLISNPNLKSHVSLCETDRKVNNNPFSLIDCIIENIEKDLNLSRDSLTAMTMITLNKNIMSIKTLCDLSDTTKFNVINSMKWTDILSLLSSKKTGTVLPVIFAISVVFVSQNPGIKNTVVQINYKTTITL
jgi:hypothetical protein